MNFNLIFTRTFSEHYNDLVSEKLSSTIETVIKKIILIFMKERIDFNYMGNLTFL